MKKLLTELKRRNVMRVAIAYAIAGWVLMQVAATVLPIFEAPPWTLKVVTFLIVLGFPIALILAWAFELTPEGIKREADVDRNILSMKTNPGYDFIRDDPRFVALLQKVGLSE